MTCHSYSNESVSAHHGQLEVEPVEENPVLTALIAAIAGVAGLVIGRWWDTQSESARWRRDRRIRSYEDVAAEFYRLREAVRLLAMLDPATPDFNAQRSRVEEAYAQWNTILSALWLHGSEHVAAAAISIDHEFNELLSEAIRTTADWTVWPQRREPLYASFDNYVDAVRRELSLPRLEALRAGAAVRQTPAAGHSWISGTTTSAGE
jgi:hypothetical protein